jgi:hypothetical protein
MAALWALALARYLRQPGPHPTGDGHRAPLA